MKIKEFTEWLNLTYPESPTTVKNRLSNCKNVEKHYGDLEKHFQKDHLNGLLEIFSYSTDDERKNKDPKHNIPINGNIRTGTATLKQSIKLYKEFKLFIEETENIETQSLTNPTQEYSNSLKGKLSSIIKTFNFNQKRHKDISVLQIELKDYLASEMKVYDWEIEHKPTEINKDSIDIYGSSKQNDTKIVIELDPHRADQVSKKFVSRLSIFIEENILYITICYPGTKKMNKNECIKYFNYCEKLCDFITQNSKTKKEYLGVFL